MAVAPRCLSLALLLVLLAGAVPGAPKFRIRYADIGGTRYLLLEDVATYYGMRFSRRAKSGRVHLTSRYSRLDFELDKRSTTLNGVAVDLGHAVREWKGKPAISDTDFRSVLDPILRYASLPRSTVSRVVIDPGHGGKDPGTTGSKLKKQEKEIVLQVARRLQAVLAAKGYAVSLTRTDDTELSLARRPAIAAARRADVFVSIHANFVAAPSVRGVESFRLCPQGTASTYGGTTNAVARTGNGNDCRNTRLAYEVQKGMVQATGAADRGVRQASFSVLREAACPAALVEIGFMSNPAEERLLGSAAYQAKIAAGIADGIDRYKQAVEHRP